MLGEPSRLLSSPLALSLRSQCWSCVRPRPDHTEYTIPPHLFRVLLLERLQLALPVTEATCNGCHEPLHTLGRHRAACTRSERVKKRAAPTERVLARVCCEAGARVKFNAALRDMNLGVPGAGERRIEVLAQDLPCFDGAQLAIDITLRSALCATGEPQPGAAEVNGAVLSACTSTRLQGVAAWWWWPLRQGAAGVTKQRISCGNCRR